MQLHLFGASTPCGYAFRNISSANVFGYTRRSSGLEDWLTTADLSFPNDFHPAGNLNSPSIWISFAPIWTFSSFFNHLQARFPDRLKGIRGVIACSSSSVETKRFASNTFDRELVSNLVQAEDLLIDNCQYLSIPCRILRPTLIYGQVGPYSDRNLSRLLALMRRLPFLPLPKFTGLRQPIHASQLAAVAFSLSQQFNTPDLDTFESERISLGGDSTMSYHQMLLALQDSLPSTDPARNCRFFLIPNRLFFTLVAPLLLYSPKAFEAVLRISSNLSHFVPTHKILATEPQPFPVLPLS